MLSHEQNHEIPGHTGYFEVIHKTVKFLGVQRAGLTLKPCIHTHDVKFLGVPYMSVKCSYYLLFLGIHIKEPQTKVSSQCKIMEGQEEDLSEDLELVALDNLRCSQPSSQPSSSTAQPSRLQTYSSKQRRLQVTRRTKGTVKDTALFTSSTFAEQCYHIIQFLRSPEIDRCFPDYLNNKHARQNFKRKAERYKWDETRQKLFYPKDDQFKNSK